MNAYERVCGQLINEPRRWLVTGAAGFIGSHLVQALLSLGQTVTGLDNFLSGKRENIDAAISIAGAGASSRFNFIEGDIADYGTCLHACKGVDVVLHQAALVSVPRSFDDPALNNRCNVDGFLNMMLAAKEAGAGSFVYASSAAVYGEQPEGAIPETAPLRPLSPYAVSKRTNELYAAVLGDDLKATGLRYMNVYGPRQDPSSPYSGVISLWSRAFSENIAPMLYGDGLNTRDFVFVEDVVQANILAALRHGKETAVFNVGTGVCTNLLELYDAIRYIASRQNPGAMKIELERRPAREGDIRFSLADIGLIRKTLGYEPRFGLKEGLEKYSKQ